MHATHHASALDEGDNGLGTHAARLGSKVDTLARALGNVAGSVTDKDSAVVHTSGAHVLRDGVGLDLDDAASLDLGASTLADTVLVLLDGGPGKKHGSN